MEIIIPIVALLLLWCICNAIVSNMLKKYGELNDYISSLLQYRKTIMFDILSLIFLVIFNIKLFLWIAIIYTIIMIIFEGILIIIALITGIDDDIKTKQVDKDLWLIFTCKFLNEIASIIMLFTIFSLLN